MVSNSGQAIKDEYIQTAREGRGNEACIHVFNMKF